MSLATRISLLAACAVGIAVAVASAAAYVTLRSQLHNRLDDSLLHRASILKNTQLIKQANIAGISGELLEAADVHVYLIYPTGRVYPAQPEISPVTSAELAVARGLQSHSFRTVSIGGSDF